MDNPRFKDEALGSLRLPDLEKIYCKDSKHKEADRFGGTVKGARLGVCAEYNSKPYSVLWENKECKKYEKASK